MQETVGNSAAALLTLSYKNSTFSQAMNSHIYVAHCITLCIIPKTSKQKMLFLNPLSSSIQFTSQLHKQLQQHEAGSRDTAPASRLPRDTIGGCSRRNLGQEEPARPTARTQTFNGTVNPPVNPIPIRRFINYWASGNYPFRGRVLIPTHRSRFLAHLIQIAGLQWKGFGQFTLKTNSSECA